MTFRDSFARRVLLWGLAAALIPLLLSQVATYLSLKATVQREIQQKINLVAEQKYRQVESFLNEREADIKGVSRSPVIVQTMHDLVVFSRDLAYPTRYSAIVQGALAYLAVFTNLYPYADAMLISTNGDVQVSLARSPELGNNLRTGPFGDTQLARAFQHCLRTRQVVLSDLRWHRVTGRPAQFLVAPILKNGAVLGFAALELRGQKIFELTQDLSGLGGSGEVVLLSLEGERVLLLSPLRTGRYLPLQHSWTVDRFSKVPLHLAPLGKKGYGVRKDHRGVTTIAWWSYLPKTHWGMVVKMDADEAFATVYRERSRSEAIALVCLILAAAGCVWGAWGVSRPIRDLQEGVRRRAAGESTQAVGTAAQDEVGQLGRLFDGLMNRMQQVTTARDGLAQEVTVHKNTETEYRRLALVATKTGQAVLIADRDRKIEWVNEAFTRLTGYALSEIAGKDPLDVMQGPATSPEAVQTLRRATQELGTARVELSLSKKSGEPYWLELHWQPVFDSAVQVEKWMAIGADITQRKAAESRAAQMAAEKEHQSQQVQTELEQQRQQSLAELAARSDELAQCKGEQAAHDGELVQAKGELENLNAILAQEREKAARDQQETEELRKELAAVCTEGERHRVELEVRAGELAQRAAELDNLSQLLVQERERRQSIQQEAERLREELAAARQASQAPQPSQETVLANVRQALNTLLPEMLATEPLGMMDFELEDVLAEVATRVGTKASQKGLEFLFDVAPDLPPVLIGDPRRLGQILTHLTTNAVASTRQGEVVVRVEAADEDDKTVLLRFAVRDTGVGLTPEQRDRLFELQIESGDASSPTAGSIGLGLVLSKHFVERMGGEIGVVSQVDKGSTFWFTARLGRSHKAPQKQPGQLPGEAGKIRALVADDSESALVVASEMLQNLGLEAVTVGSGQPVLEALAEAPAGESPFDLVILDQDMPGMDGLETARRIRAHAGISKRPAIILAAVRGHEGALVQPGIIPLDGTLLKPVTAWRLFEAISAALRQSPAAKTSAEAQESQAESIPALTTALRVVAHPEPELKAEPSVDETLVSDAVEPTSAPTEASAEVPAQESALKVPAVAAVTSAVPAVPGAEVGISVDLDEDRPPWEEAPPVGVAAASPEPTPATVLVPETLPPETPVVPALLEALPAEVAVSQAEPTPPAAEASTKVAAAAVAPAEDSAEEAPAAASPVVELAPAEPEMGQMGRLGPIAEPPLAEPPVTEAPGAEPPVVEVRGVEPVVAESPVAEAPVAAPAPEPLASPALPRAEEPPPTPPLPPAAPEPPSPVEAAKPLPSPEPVRKPRRPKQPKLETMDLFGDLGPKPASTAVESHEMTPSPPEPLVDEPEPAAPRAKKPKREEKPATVETSKSVPSDELPARIVGVNLAEGLKRAGGDRGEYLNQLREFGHQEEGALGRIREALDENDLKGAEKLAHALKESSAQLGMNEVAQAATAFEAALRSHEPLLVTSAFDELEHKLAALASALKSLEPVAPAPAKPAAAPATGPWDKPVFLRKLQMLRELVESGDAEARHLLGQIRAVSGGKYAERLAAIEQHIQSEDFGQAADIAVDLEMALQK